MMWLTIVTVVLFLIFVVCTVMMTQAMNRMQNHDDARDAFMGALAMTIFASLVAFIAMAYQGSLLYAPWPNSPWIASVFAGVVTYFVARQYRQRVTVLRIASSNQPEG